MKSYIKFKMLAKIAGLVMILTATIRFFALNDAERVAMSSWQVTYMATILIGGIFNVFDKDNERRARCACFCYIIALLFSAIIGIALRNGIHTDFLLIGTVFLISLIRYGSIIIENGDRAIRTDEKNDSCEKMEEDIVPEYDPNIIRKQTQITENRVNNGHIEIDLKQIIKDEAEWRREQMGQSLVEQELERIDKMDGCTFEYWCARLLEASGFKDVDVTKRSGDQGVDVLATLDGVRYAIQCKCYASDLGNKPVQEVYAGIAIYKCQLGSVMTNRYFTAGAKELAAATGISLWDRDWIISLLEELDADSFPI